MAVAVLSILLHIYVTPGNLRVLSICLPNFNSQLIEIYSSVLSPNNYFEMQNDILETKWLTNLIRTINAMMYLNIYNFKHHRFPKYYIDRARIWFYTLKRGSDDWSHSFCSFCSYIMLRRFIVQPSSSVQLIWTELEFIFWKIADFIPISQPQNFQ